MIWTPRKSRKRRRVSKIVYRGADAPLLGNLYVGSKEEADRIIANLLGRNRE